MTGGTVTCTDTSTGFEAPVGVDDLTVIVEAGATLDDSNPLIDAAVAVNDGNTVHRQRTRVRYGWRHRR